MEASEVSKTVSPMHIEEAPPSGNSVPVKLSLWQAVQKWPKVAGYCLALTTAILLWGYDMAMVGNLASLPQFQYVDLVHDGQPPLTLHPTGKTTVYSTMTSGLSSPNG